MQSKPRELLSFKKESGKGSEFEESERAYPVQRLLRVSAKSSLPIVAWTMYCVSLTIRLAFMVTFFRLPYVSCDFLWSSLQRKRTQSRVVNFSSRRTSASKEVRKRVAHSSVEETVSVALISRNCRAPHAHSRRKQKGTLVCLSLPDADTN